MIMTMMLAHEEEPLQAVRAFMDSKSSQPAGVPAL
jgi:hypothetical protein